LIKVSSEALIPKERVKQEQRQMALNALGHFAPMMSKWTPEQQNQFYSDVIFPTFGMSEHPSFIRRAFGKPEPALPLPKGAINLEEPVKTKSPVSGKITAWTPGLRLPPTQPFAFPKPVPEPLIEPEHRAEIEAEAKRRFPDSPEEQEFWTNQQIQTAMTKVRPGKEDLIAQAARLMEIGRGKSPSELSEGELRERLIPPGMRAPYEEHLEEKEIGKLVKEATIAGKETQDWERKQRISLQKQREARYAEEFNRTLEFNKEKLASVERQHKELLKSKGMDRQTAIYINMVKSQVDQELKAMIEHNKMEQHRKDMDPDYIPSIQSSSPILARWDDIYSKVMSFGVGGERQPAPLPGGVTEPPKILSPLDKARKKLKW
jgi:hypothetical protein